MTPDPISGPALADMLTELRQDLGTRKRLFRHGGITQHALLHTQGNQEAGIAIVAAECVEEGMLRAEARWRGEELPFVHLQGDEMVTFNLSYFDRLSKAAILTQIETWLREGSVTIAKVERHPRLYHTRRFGRPIVSSIRHTGRPIQ